jgi:MFS family permease
VAAFGGATGFFLANLAILAFSQLSRDQFLSWGWRVPFWLSLIMVVIGLWIRLGIFETPIFQDYWAPSWTSWSGCGAWATRAGARRGARRSHAGRRGLQAPGVDQSCGFGVSIAKRSLLLPERIGDGRTKKAR